jgi:hypothetical protein
MNISIHNSDSGAVMTHDLLGNVFLEYKGNRYCFIVSPKGVMLLPVKDSKLSNISYRDVNFIKGKLLAIDKSLKSTAKDKLMKDGDTTEYEFNESFFPEEEHFYRASKNMKYAKNDLCDEYDLDPMFTFYNFDKKFISKTGFPYSANYHFLVIDGNRTSHKIVYLAEEENNVCSYRINIHTNGFVKFNIVSDKVMFYNITDKNGSLTVEIEKDN